MKILKKITSLSLAVVFLLSSMSFTVSSMVCIKSGKGKVSLSIQKDCCKKKPLPSKGVYFTKGGCCDIKNLFIKLHDFNPSKKLTVDQPLILNSFGYSENERTFSSQNYSLHHSDLPPPYHGRSILNFISTYRI